MHVMMINAYEFGQFLRVLLWICVPMAMGVLLITTWLQYRRRQKFSDGLLLAVEGVSSGKEEAMASAFPGTGIGEPGRGTAGMDDPGIGDPGGDVHGRTESAIGDPGRAEPAIHDLSRDAPGIDDPGGDVHGRAESAIGDPGRAEPAIHDLSRDAPGMNAPGRDARAGVDGQSKDDRVEEAATRVADTFGQDDYKENLYKGILWMKDKYEQYREMADQRYERLKDQLTKVERRYEDLLFSLGGARPVVGVKPAEETPPAEPAGMEAVTMAERIGMEPIIVVEPDRPMVEPDRPMAEPMRSVGPAPAHPEEPRAEKEPRAEIVEITPVDREERTHTQELEEQLARTRQRLEEELGRVRYQLEDEIARSRRQQEIGRAHV